MISLNKVIFSVNEPSNTNVLWLKPNLDSFDLLYFNNGEWKVQQSTNLNVETKDINEISLINKANFLPYYHSVCRKKLNTGLNSKWKKRCNIAHISDCHCNNDDNDRGLNNLKEIRDVLDSNSDTINAAVFTGDLTNGWSDDVNIIEDTLQKVADIIHKDNKVPTLSLLGNHDANDYLDGGEEGDAQTSLSRISQLSFLNQSTSDFDMDIDYLNYYYDIVAKGEESFNRIRIIVLNQLDHYGTRKANGNLDYCCLKEAVYGQYQIDFLLRLLERTPENTGIIICNHFPFESYNWNPDKSLLIDGNFVQPWNMIPEIVDAWQNRTSIQSKIYTDKKGVQNIEVDCDFSNVDSKSEFIAYLCGHTHYKTYKKVEGFNQLMILEDASGSHGTVFSNTSRLPNTCTSNAFSVLSIDREEGTIYRTSYGAFKEFDEVDRNRTEIINYRL